MNEIKKMYNRVGLLGIAAQALSTGEIIGWKPMEFTADKQLKLIDWFVRNEADIEIIFDYEDELHYLKAYDKETIAHKDFAEALANLINIHFEDFIDEEKEEIKEILK